MKLKRYGQNMNWNQIMKMDDKLRWYVQVTNYITEF